MLAAREEEEDGGVSRGGARGDPPGASRGGVGEPLLGALFLPSTGDCEEEGEGRGMGKTEALERRGVVVVTLLLIRWAC